MSQKMAKLNDKLQKHMEAAYLGAALKPLM